jgi:putative salt-induced outer membrane protein
MLRWILVLSIIAPALTAQETAPKPVQFTGDIGYVNTAGNTDISTLNIGEKLDYNLTHVTFKHFFSLVYGETDGNTTTSLWRTGVRADYALSSRLALFTSLGFDRNRFAGIQRRFEEGVGLGFKAIAEEKNKLEFEAGIAVTQQRSTTDVDDNFTSARAAGTFQHNFTPTAFFQQMVEVLPNLELSEDLRVNSETSLVAPLSKRFAVKLSYVIRYDKLPEPTFKKTDRLFTSGLQISL